jgi:hypothetical protein
MSRPVEEEAMSPQHEQQATVDPQHANDLSELCNLHRLNYNNVGELARAGGVARVVISALDENRGDSRVVVMALRALYTIASDEPRPSFPPGSPSSPPGSPSHSQTSTFPSGGIEALVAAMEELPGDEKVQEWACAVLWRLAWDNDTQAIKIAEAQGIWRVTEAMTAHAAAEGVQENGCWALINLAWNDENAPQVEIAGGVELAMKALMAFETSLGVQEAGCGVLLVLITKRKELVNRIRSAGGVDRVKHALAMDGMSENTKRWCDGLLDRLGDPVRLKALVRSMKAAIKHTVSTCCSTEVEMYRLRQQATNEVRNHIQKVHARAQRKIITKIAKLQPGEDIDDPLLDPLDLMQNVRDGMPEITEKLAFDVVLQTSKELSPAFRWLSAGEPTARQQTKAAKLAASTSSSSAHPAHLTIELPRTLARKLRQRSALRDEVMRELEKVPPSSCETLPLRYSPYVGLVFENPTVATANCDSIGKASREACSGARVGAVVHSVVEKGVVAHRIWDAYGGVDEDAEEGDEINGATTLINKLIDFVAPGDFLVDIDGHRVDASTSLSRIIHLLAGKAIAIDVCFPSAMGTTLHEQGLGLPIALGKQKSIALVFREAQ